MPYVKDFEMDSDFENASVLFANLEVLTKSKGFRDIKLSDKFQESIVCVVAEEAHCIVVYRRLVGKLFFVFIKVLHKC